MNIKAQYLTIIILLSAFILSGCNESVNIWKQYISQSFHATVVYARGDCEVCAKVSAARGGEADAVTVEFSAPDTLRGAVGACTQNEFRLTCQGITLTGEAARAMLDIPASLAVSEAIAFEKLTDGDQKLLAVITERGKIIFDAQTQKPIRAEIDGIVCDIITFAWK